MYAVVGCSNCGTFWIVEGRPETTACPRCRTRHEFDRLRVFHRADEATEAREARSALLAARQEREDAHERLDSFAAMETAAQESIVDDEEYLTEFGLDPEAVAAAGESESSGPTSRREIVLDALGTLETPTRSAVREYAVERGVPEEAVERALEALGRQGSIAEEESGFRLL